MHKLVLVRHGESTWNLENRFTGWTDVDLTANGVEQARAAGRLLKEAGYEFDRCCTSVLKRAIWTLWHALDEMDRTWLPVTNDWRLNERHYGALQGLNKAETTQQVRRRAGAGLAPQLRHAAAGAARRTIRAASAATRATAASRAGEVPLTECLKDTVARVLPYWNDAAGAGDPRRRAAADLGARQQHAGAGEVPRRHLRRRHRRPQHPERHPAGLRARRGAEADPQLLPRRPGGRRRGRRRGGASGLGPAEAAIAERAGDVGAQQRAASCAPLRRRPMSRGGRNASRATTPSPQAEFHRLSASVVAPTNSTAALTSSLDRRSAAPPAAPASRSRSPPAAGWRGRAAGRGRWRSCPRGRPRPSARRRAPRPSRGPRAARRACARARGRACRPSRPGARSAASALTSALETKRASGTTAWTTMMSSQETWLTRQQAAAAGRRALDAQARCRARAASSATTSGSAPAAPPASGAGKRNRTMAEAVQPVHDRAQQARDGAKRGAAPRRDRASA